MKIVIPANSKWPLKSAAVISEASNVHLFMKELVRSEGWRIFDPPATPDIGLSFLENGTSFFYVIDETTDLSAYESIRTILSHPAGRLTPIIAMVADPTQADLTVYQRVLNVAVAKKPLTPNLFLPTFRETLKLWESPLFLAMRRCAYSLLNDETEQVIPVLKKLMEIPQAVPYCTQSLVQILANRNEWREAEQMLMSAVRMFPRMPSLMMTVASFYQAGHMPALALRFYTKLRGICNSSHLFSFDIAQAALSLGQLDVAIEAFTEWLKTKPSNERVTQFMARLYMADGRDASLEKMPNMNKAHIRRLQEVWDQAENQGNTPQSA